MRLLGKAGGDRGKMNCFLKCTSRALCPTVECVIHMLLEKLWKAGIKEEMGLLYLQFVR